MKYESVHTRPEPGPERLSWNYEGTNLAWEVNRPLPEGFFHLEFPESVTVNDHRRLDEK